jgi:predicted ATPase
MKRWSTGPLLFFHKTSLFIKENRMLTGFQGYNFKAFQDTGPIDLAPLTLLSGVNSAGKSSLIQMLLLLKQTLESGPSQALNPGQGPFLATSLGDNFNDFLFEHPKLSDASLTYHLAFAYEEDDEEELKLYQVLNQLLTDLALDLPGKLSSSVMVTFGWGPYGSRGRPSVRVATLQIKLSVDEHPLVGLQFQPKGGNYQIEHIEEATHSKLADLALNQLEIDGLSHFLPDSLIINMQRQPLGEAVPPSFLRLFRLLFATVRRDLSERIYYLNSFRVPPARLYRAERSPIPLVNPNGENFASVLWGFREEQVHFVHANGRRETLPLHDMVTRILSDTLGLKQRVQVKPVGENLALLEVKVETLGPTASEVTLPDVGLGYNQVLPIIVQGLLTPPRGLVIFEQPEIHLHPEIQARLINFFIGLARAGRRVLIETHSSHKVDRLCLAIAKERSYQLEKKINILFVHPPDEKHPSARIEPVRINSYGEILNWPPYFLPDIASLYEETLAASLAKQREEEKRRKMRYGAA